MSTQGKFLVLATLIGSVVIISLFGLGLWPIVSTIGLVVVAALLLPARSYHVVDVPRERQKSATWQWGQKR